MTSLDSVPGGGRATVWTGRAGAVAAGVLIVLALGIPLASAGFTLTRMPAQWVGLLFDDAYYYLGVARHLSGEGRSLFAQPFDTNGYQPLWLLLLSGLSALVGGDRTLLAAAAHFLVAAVVALFLLLSRKGHGSAWPAAFVTLAFPWVITAGLETVLVPPLALLYFRSEDWRSRGGWSALLFLARLDTVGLILGREVFDWVLRRQPAWRHHLVLLPVVAAYCAVNLWLFGTALPVSGQAKAVGNVPGENLSAAFHLLGVGLAALLATGALLLVKPFARWRNRAAIVASMVALACSAAYYGVLSGWPVWDWYAWPVCLLVYFVLDDLVREEGQRERLALPGRAVGLLLLATYLVQILPLHLSRYDGVLRPEAERTWPQDNVVMAQAIGGSGLTAGTTFVMGDRAGSFGYFLDDRFRFLHTEGLVGPKAYLDALRADRAEAFLDRMGPDFLVVDGDPQFRSGGLIAFAEPAQGMSARIGPFLLCFPEAARSHRFDGDGVRERRMVFPWAAKVACPPAMVSAFLDRRGRYGAVRLRN